MISRKAAIDALEKEKPTPFVNKDGSIDPFGAGRQNQWYRDGIAIMNLPSAQPEKMQLSTEKTQLSEEDATKDTTFDCISRQAARYQQNGGALRI